MNLNPISDAFIHQGYFESVTDLKKARLLVKSSLLTSLFSTTYLLLSLIVDFQMGVYFMIFNIVGYLLLPLLVKTTIPINIVGNLYTLIGAIAIMFLVHYSGGFWSPILPWLIAVPTLAMLVVNRQSAYVWGVIVLVIITYFGIQTIQNNEPPITYNQEFKSVFSIIVMNGLLLIILVIALVFEFNNRHALETLEVRNREIAELSKEKDYIIQIMAHDLRNPLHAIKTVLRFISQDTGGKENFQKFIDVMNESVDKSTELITKVTTMSEVEQKNLDLKLESTEVKQAVEEVIGMYKHIAENKKIRLNKEWEGDAFKANLDRTFFIQIMDNLISNAIKFSPQESAVNIRLSDTKDTVRIEVEDNGPGFTLEDSEKLFGKFARLSAQPTGGESSTGLGLFLVKKYVEMMKGTIRLVSEAGSGACFTIEFPNLNTQQV